MIYSGRESDSGPHRNLANDIVIKLCSVYFGTGRDIYVDWYFTSHGLVCNLLQQNLTLIWTIMANRHEIPSQFEAAKGREIESTKALYDHSNKILLLSYVPKRNKNVLMMSSSHSSTSITDCHKKPTVITDYNERTGGVDSLDKNCEEFSCLRKTNRWPMVINYNLINVATNNAFIVMRGSGKCDRKTDFLKQLSFQLAQPYVSNRKLRDQRKVLAKKMGFIDRHQTGKMLQMREAYSPCILGLPPTCLPATQKNTKKHILHKILNNLCLYYMFVYFCV